MSPALSPDSAAPAGDNPDLVPCMVWRNRITTLVVDSGTLTRTVLRSLLIVYGVESESVTSGEAAAELTYAGRGFDIIFIDAHLDGASGVQTCRKLRTMGVCSIIVGITAMHTNRQKAAFLAAGADDYIEKPVNPEKFIPILAEIDSHQ